MMKIFFATLFTVTFISCNSKNDIPSGILKPAKMQLVLWDVLEADAFVNNFVSKDSSKVLAIESVKLQKDIFTIHKITKDEFFNSYNFYKANPSLIQPLLDSLINKATREKYSITKGFRDTLKAQ